MLTADAKLQNVFVGGDEGWEREAGGAVGVPKDPRRGGVGGEGGDASCARTTRTGEKHKCKGGVCWC